MLSGKKNYALFFFKKIFDFQQPLTFSMVKKGKKRPIIKSQAFVNTARNKLEVVLIYINICFLSPDDPR